MNFPWIQKLVLLQTLKLDQNGNEWDESFPPKSIVTLGRLTHLLHLYLPKWMGTLENKVKVKLRFNGLIKLEILENFDTRWCEVKDLPKLTNLQRLWQDSCSGMISFLNYQNMARSQNWKNYLRSSTNFVIPILEHLQKPLKLALKIKNKEPFLSPLI